MIGVQFVRVWKSHIIDRFTVTFPWLRDMMKICSICDDYLLRLIKKSNEKCNLKQLIPRHRKDKIENYKCFMTKLLFQYCFKSCVLIWWYFFTGNKMFVYIFSHIFPAFWSIVSVDSVCRMDQNSIIKCQSIIRKTTTEDQPTLLSSCSTSSYLSNKLTFVSFLQFLDS